MLGKNNKNKTKYTLFTKHYSFDKEEEEGGGGGGGGGEEEEEEEEEEETHLQFECC